MSEVKPENSLMAKKSKNGLSLSEWCKENKKEDLLLEWDYENNGLLIPELVTKGAIKKAWWKCSRGHRWQATPNDRTRGNGCPYCSGRYAVKGETDLVSTFPELVKEWDYERNNPLTPYEVKAGTNKKVWWKCSKGHSWKAVISSRATGIGCPYCSNKATLQGYNDLATTCPELASEWNYDKNNSITPQMVTKGSNKKVWWKCAQGHEWQAVISSRSNGNGCPICSNKRVLKGYNDLSTTFPSLVSEWDYKKNNPLTPEAVTKGSNQVVWWKCLKHNHSYKSAISNRTESGTGCPICAREKIKVGIHDFYLQKNGSLAENYPEIAKEWHPTKNGMLTPNDVTANTGKKVWWLGTCGHEWQATPGHRITRENVKGTGCPICSNKVVLLGFNDLDTTRPDLSVEWNFEKNDPLTPLDVTEGSNKNVWWKCKYGHEWKANISDRSNGNGCPKCSSQGTSLPEQGIAFYLENVCKVSQRIKIAGQEVDVFLPEYKIGIEYDGRFFHPSTRKSKEIEKDQKLKENGIKLIRIKESHVNKTDDNIIFFNTDYLGVNYEWAIKQLCKLLEELTGDERFNTIIVDTQKDIISIRERVNLYLKENSISILFPELAKEWHPTNNGTLTPDMFSVGANTKIWWNCKERHEWQASINNRVKGNGCPYCSGKSVLKGYNDLATVKPDYAKEWNYEKNGDLTPYDITRSSNKVVWWKCIKGHEWKAAPNSRSGCPYCAGRKVLKGFNDLATIRPDIAKEWDYEKNGDLKPYDVTRAANKVVWWKCEKGHEYKANIGNRTVLGRGCPICGRKKQVVSNNINQIKKKGSLAESYPEIAKEWHPTKNNLLNSSDVTCASSKRIWWLCSTCGHEWQTSISNRIGKKSGCPVCAKSRQKLKYEEKIKQNPLSISHPDLLKEWDFEKNRDLNPTEVGARSDAVVWWKCSMGHKWQTKIVSRTTAKTGCPYCSDKANKKVLCVETNCIYESLSEASEKVFGNFSNITNISNVCKGKRNTAGGYHWKFIEKEV